MIGGAELTREEGSKGRVARGVFLETFPVEGAINPEVGDGAMNSENK